MDESKFANYYDYQTYVNSIQPHQVLAINRGENLKVGVWLVWLVYFIKLKKKNEGARIYGTELLV